MGNGSQGQVVKQRVNSQKPSSAPSKNRIRSQSPINAEGQPQNQHNNYTGKQKNTMIGGPNFGTAGNFN